MMDFLGYSEGSIRLDLCQREGEYHDKSFYPLIMIEAKVSVACSILVFSIDMQELRR